MKGLPRKIWTISVLSNIELGKIINVDKDENEIYEMCSNKPIHMARFSGSMLAYEKPIHWNDK